MQQTQTTTPDSVAVAPPPPDEPPTEVPSYMAFAGDMKDDPLFDEWVEAMQKYRRRTEDDPDYL